MSQQEIDSALDALEAEHGSFENTDNNEINDEAEEEHESPPGFIKTQEEWVALGKDPADFKGENAYKAEYDRIQEIRDLKDTMKKVVSTTEAWQKQQEEFTNSQVEKARQDALTELSQAKEDDDVEAALKASERLNTLQTKPQASPIVPNFVSKTPIIDPSNSLYDQAFHEDFIMLHNSNLDKLLGGDRARQGELSEGQIQRSLQLAMKQAQEFHPGKFKSSKNNRQSAPGNQQRNQQHKPAKISGYTGNSNNPRDTNPANDIYEMLKKSDPAAAETFKKNLEGAA